MFKNFSKIRLGLKNILLQENKLYETDVEIFDSNTCRLLKPIVPTYPISRSRKNREPNEKVHKKNISNKNSKLLGKTKVFENELTIETI